MPDEGRIPVHIKNNRSGELVFRITPERFAAACRRHPEPARRIDAGIDWDLDNFETAMRTAQVLLTWDLPTDELARRAPNLKWIHIIGAGVEHLAPFDWLPAGVRLTNNSGVHLDKFADYATMALLMLHARLPKFADDQRHARWNPLFTPPIAGRTLVVVGVGKMGGVVARCGRRLGLRVLGVRRGGRPARGVDRMVEPAQLAEILPAADLVVVTLPQTPETGGLFGAEQFRRMKPGAGFANLGRGAVVDQAALAAALKEGQLSGAILDVVDPEPLPPDDPLWTAPNLTITPHISSDDQDGYIPATLDLFFDNLSRLIAGRGLRNRVDPRLGY
ncbi:MAG: NAD(P)-dependent oxidoreductase [Alphaproteobacteria bacterium]|jgi:phosphoglycerate dehydrogenase-like enzyme|nr:NAD(P)-dependent oxidoreductase [Alphaproteobacteria bacterium]MDP6563723.1 NAD(P)-dependent oxidoreductase [Alphaproteobacteria bacterium]MDP6815302.1 NAD(P)-dependent oxidoreductase [Alphaproteobacteria bacterium]